MGDVGIYAKLLATAAGTTLWLSWFSLIFAAVGGTVIALLRTSKFLPLRIVALLYTEIFRSIPVLILMFFCFFGVPLVFNIDVSPFMAATVALALSSSSLMSEVVRAGLESVGRGQWEAAWASGMRYGQVLLHIVSPQAIRVILPPSVGVFVATVKESAIASIIGYVELTKTGLLMRESSMGGFGPIVAMAALYFIMNYAISLGGARLERKFRLATNH